MSVHLSNNLNCPPFADYIHKDYCNDISNLNVNLIREYLLYLRGKPKYLGHPYTPKQSETLSPQTLRGHTRGLKAFSTWLFTEDYTKENRLKNLKLPEVPLKVIEPLTQDEIGQIISSIKRNTLTGERNKAIFITLPDTGLRASEIANITLGNLNLTDGYIKVMGKGAKERIVPIGKYV